jgi:uncharacterized protein YjbJ (UPF0337 family)
MKSSTKDKIKGGFREAKGKVKEKAGNTTGNPNLRDRGTAEKAGGKLQRKVGDVKKVFEQSAVPGNATDCLFFATKQNAPG